VYTNLGFVPVFSMHSFLASKQHRDPDGYDLLVALGCVRSNPLTSTVDVWAKLYWWSFGTKILSLTVSKIFNLANVPQWLT